MYGVPESTSGEDCRARPGVAPDGAACVRGVCHATACVPGWSLRRNRASSACIYHIYGGIYRGDAAAEAWVASHIAQWAPTPTAVAPSEVPWAEEPEFMDEDEVLKLIAQVQKSRAESGERPLPVQIVAAARVQADAERARVEAERPRVVAGVDTADEETPGAEGVAEEPVRAAFESADEETPSVRMGTLP